MRRRADAIGERHGIRIGYGSPGTFYLPPHGPKDAAIAGAKITQANPEAIPRALDAIEQALAVYPPGFFASAAKAIFLCDSLTFDGAAAGGTYGPAWLILAAPSAQGDAVIYETVRLGVHHEFSSLLWNKSPGLRTRWFGLLPLGWTPSPSNAAALQSKPGGDGRLAQGFLTPYAATSAENDFNTYAETAFDNPKRLLALVNAPPPGYPAIKEKSAVLLTYYAQLDPRMKNVFENLGLGAIPPAEPIGEALKVAPVAIPQGTIVR